jgi:hypothetical protein
MRLYAVIKSSKSDTGAVKELATISSFTRAICRKD